MAIHQCSYCNYGSTRRWVVRRHMESKHNAQQLGGNRFSDPHQKANVEKAHFIHSSQNMNLQASDQHSFNPQRTDQDLYSPYDIRLKENFKLFISGPSRCGKTFFVADLLENIETFAKEPPKKIIYVYKVWQSKFDEMRSLVHVFLEDCESIVAKIQERATGQPVLVIFDDLLNSKSLVDIATLFTVDGRHMNMSLVFLTQRMFVNNEHFRQISQNCDYFVIFKNPRNSSEIRTLAQQLTPGNLGLIDIYMQATKDPFSYLFINLTQECQPQVKYLSKLFDYDNSVRVYCADFQDSKGKRKIYFKEILLVDRTFFNKVNNENHILLTNNFSPIQGKEIIGSKKDECTECESPASAPPEPTQSRPSTSIQPPPSQPASVLSSKPSLVLPPYRVLPPAQAPSPHQASSPSSASSVQHGGVKPFESEAHQWIDNVTYDMQVDPLVPTPRFTDSEHMNFSSSPQLPHVLQYSEPQVLQHQEPQALTYESKIPAVEMMQEASSLPDPKYLHRVQNDREAPEQVMTYIRPVLRSPDVEMEALPSPKYLLWGRKEHEAPKQLVTYKKPVLRSPDVEMEALPALKEPTYPLTIPTVNEYSSFLCTLCNSYFNTRKALERHNKNIHDAYQQKIKGMKHKEIFTCDICYDEFKTQKVLDRHITNIHGAFTQKNRGIKRQMEKEDKYPKKYVKWS